jgi:WD40 repeat protein
LNIIKLIYAHTNAVQDLKLHNNQFLISGSKDNTAKVWFADGGNLLCTFSDHTAAINVLEIVNGNVASGSDDFTVRIWSMTTCTQIRLINHHTYFITGLKLLLNGYLAAASRDKLITIWNITTGTLIRTLTGHTAQIVTMERLANGNLASGSSSSFIKTWNFNTGSNLLNINLGPLTYIKLLNDGHIAASYTDRTLRKIDPTTGTVIFAISNAHSAKINYLNINDNGYILSGSDDNNIKVWKMDGQLLFTLSIGTPVRSLVHTSSKFYFK